MSHTVRQSKRHIVITAFLSVMLFIGLISTQAQHASKIENLLSELTWRPIGPAVMGGRTVDIEAVESNPSIIYAAVGPSGVWKSENAGTTWEPVFFKEKTVSVGALAIAQSNPNIIWVGTGEATCRNSVTIGDGVYKSTDGGKTWSNMGLADTRHISQIIVNRGDPNIVYVAAMGHLWGPNTERGVYRTLDGGRTWQKVLYINENTGIADLAIDPFNSQILYAAAYEHRRKPWEYIGAGPGSGLYRTSDGGLTWSKVSGGGFPEGLMGRIGIAFARSKPGVLYVLVEHNDPGIWLSTDDGQTWQRMCDAATFRRVNTRPFYYSHIFVDPTDEKTIYVLSTGLFVSNDMGKKFKAIGTTIHPDHHALWINPSNPKHLIDGNDGGIDISYDGGLTWIQVQSIDAAEVYNVGYDMRVPYHVYVGLQDNGSWGGPSNSLDTRGILNEHWYSIGGGDGFYVRADPIDPNWVYANSQMGNIIKHDLKTGRAKMIRPEASFKEKPYRFNWNTPIVISSHDPAIIYTAANVLFRSNDRGQTWMAVSPDLTSNDLKKQKTGVGPLSPENSGAEVHCTITTISESPLDREVLYCGTDDGNLQLTRDGGKTWKNVALNIPGLPKNSWCSRVEASRFFPGTAYVSFDNHRFDDYAPYLYKTTDFGKTWKSIKGNLPNLGWIHVVKEDLKNPNLLFAGTEFGVFATLDGGVSWFSLKNKNLPTVAVHDIAIHPRENDLIIGTHNRGVWILDDISYLQEMNDSVHNSELHLFSIRPAIQFITSNRGESYSRPPFSGKNPPSGLTISFYIKNDLNEKPKFKIVDEQGNTVHEFMSNDQKAGLKRIIWDFQFVPTASDGKKYQPAGVVAAGLPMVSPGKYVFSLEAPSTKLSMPFEIFPDPRLDFSYEIWKEQVKLAGDILKISRLSGQAITTLRTIRRHFNKIKDSQSDKLKQVDFQSLFSQLDHSLLAIETVLIPGDMTLIPADYETALRGGNFSRQVLFSNTSIINYQFAPTEMDYLKTKELSEIFQAAQENLNKIIIDILPALNSKLNSIGEEPFPVVSVIK